LVEGVAVAGVVEALVEVGEEAAAPLVADLVEGLLEEGALPVPGKR